VCGICFSNKVTKNISFDEEGANVPYKYLHDDYEQYAWLNA